MNLNQLIKEHIKDENNNLLPQGYFMWKQLLNSINTKLNKLGFNESYFFNNNLIDLNLKVNDKFQSLIIKDNKIYHTSISKFNNKIEGAKTTLIDILQLYLNCVKQVLSLVLYSGKLVTFNNEEKYVLGYLNKNNSFIEVGSLLFKETKENEYIVYSELSSEVIIGSVQLNSLNKGLYIANRASLNEIIIIPLKMNEEGVLKYSKSLEEKLTSLGYRVELDSSKDLDKTKIDRAYINGYPLIIEVGPRDISLNQVEIINPLNEIIVKADINRIESLILNIFKKISIDLINNQLKQFLLNNINISSNEELINNSSKIRNIIFDGTKETYLHLEEIFKNQIILLPFNQELFDSVDFFTGKEGKYLLRIYNLEK